MPDYQIVVVGLGGVGTILVERLARFLNYSRDISSKILLIDGDSYEMKNYARQEFSEIGSKAEVKELELQMKFPRMRFMSENAFITEANVGNFIKDGSIVFMCVDNHKTRKIISNYCKNLKDITLISGGNEFEDGNVQIYVRREGVDLTPDICAYHPEIQDPTDKLPTEMSCEELSNSAPQLYFTNLGVATIMCWAFYNAIIRGKFLKSEVYFDITTMTADSKSRTLKTE